MRSRAAAGSPRRSGGTGNPELRERRPEIPWRGIGDTRNRVIHEYFDVDMDIVETIVRDDPPPLSERLTIILKEIEEGHDN